MLEPGGTCALLAEEPAAALSRPNDSQQEKERGQEKALRYPTAIASQSFGQLLCRAFSYGPLKRLPRVAKWRCSMWVLWLTSLLLILRPCSPAARPSRIAIQTSGLPSGNLQTNCKIHLRTQAVQGIKHNKVVAHWQRQSVSCVLSPPLDPFPSASSLALLTHKSFASAARELSNGKQCKNIPTVEPKVCACPAQNTKLEIWQLQHA